MIAALSPLDRCIWSRRVALAAAWFVTLCLLPACGETEPQRLERLYALASTNPGAAQASLVTQWKAEQITMQGALGLAHDRVEQVADAGSVAFAGVVLGAIDELEGPIAQREINEFFWMRTGTLAANAAAAAYNGGSVPAARSLVLAGPDRWKTDDYWNRHPAHDALASYLLHLSGESQVAITRLRDRPDPAPEVLKAMEDITAAMRATPPQDP